ncbi:MAG TPA: hypothetical protein VHV78_10210 [Gemmatimonadaceae bacterium]|nr:hypothetical protein [Gemmatimonadaceae bacterium]
MPRDVFPEGNSGRPPASLAARVIAAWALVGIPLAWGVWQVFQKSLDLFR